MPAATISTWPSTPTPPARAVRAGIGASSPFTTQAVPRAAGRQSCSPRLCREIYPLPDQVTTRSTTTLAEVKRHKAPTVLLEIGYHDNTADAEWIAGHIDLIAQTLVQAMTEYFGLPYVYPGPSQPGLAVTDSGGPVNLRAYPSVQGQALTQIPNGATVTVFGQYQGWYVVLYEDMIGYASAASTRL